jgi:hypothetical protein
VVFIQPSVEIQFIDVLELISKYQVIKMGFDLFHSVRVLQDDFLAEKTVFILF